MFQNIIWDVDGTLFDTYPAITRAFQLALQDYKIAVPLDKITDLAKISLGFCATSLAEQYQLSASELAHSFEAHYADACLAEQPPFAGVITVCEYICSLGGKNVIVTHREQKSTLDLLDVHHMRQYFSGFITRDDGYPKKPDPAAFAAILQVYQLNPSHTLAIGDRAIDILAGQAAGLPTCLFGPATEAATADLTISSFTELYRYLESANC